MLMMLSVKIYFRILLYIYIYIYIDIHLLFVNRQHNKENTKIRKEIVNKIAVEYIYI